MELKQQFTITHDVQDVWRALSDVSFAVGCLPGAELDPSEDGVHYRGRMKVKLGPLSAAFAGDAQVERDEEARLGTVHWTGVDSRSNSRAKATMNYRVSAAENPAHARVDITADVALTGALAQFGRSGIIQDVANRLTAIFADNLQQSLGQRMLGAAAAGGEGEPAVPGQEAARPAQAAQLRALPLLWSVLRGRLAALLRRWADGLDRPR